MSHMMTCSRCDGFLTDAMTSCPHCDAVLRDDAGLAAGSKVLGGVRKAALALGCAATSMTLMACYGMGPEEYYPPTNVDSACQYAGSLGEDDSVKHVLSELYVYTNALGGSCGGDQQPERIYLVTPSATGDLKVSWTSDAGVTVYLLDDCVDGNELACEAGSNAGEVTVAVEAGIPVTIVVDGAGDNAASYTLTTELTPE